MHANLNIHLMNNNSFQRDTSSEFISATLSCNSPPCMQCLNLEDDAGFYQSDLELRVFPTLPGHFCWRSFILIVTCGYETAGSRASFVLSQKPPAVDTNISGHSWNTHHLTCHSVTIPSALCGKLQAKMYSDTNISLDWSPIWPLMCEFGNTCVCAAVSSREAIFHAWLWSGILHMTWYDDTGPIKGWGWVKKVMTGQAENYTVIWHLKGIETQEGEKAGEGNVYGKDWG